MTISQNKVGERIIWSILSKTEDDELMHYGVKGMQWGVRRYQNNDGSLTSAGKKRYNKMSDDKLQKVLYKQVKKLEPNNPIGQINGM